MATYYFAEAPFPLPQKTKPVRGTPGNAGDTHSTSTSNNEEDAPTPTASAAAFGARLRSVSSSDSSSSDLKAASKEAAATENTEERGPPTAPKPKNAKAILATLQAESTTDPLRGTSRTTSRQTSASKLAPPQVSDRGVEPPKSAMNTTSPSKSRKMSNMSETSYGFSDSEPMSAQPKLRRVSSPGYGFDFGEDVFGGPLPPPPPDIMAQMDATRASGCIGGNETNALNVAGPATLPPSSEDLPPLDFVPPPPFFDSGDDVGEELGDLVLPPPPPLDFDPSEGLMPVPAPNGLFQPPSWDSEETVGASFDASSRSTYGEPPPAALLTSAAPASPPPPSPPSDLPPPPSASPPASRPSSHGPSSPEARSTPRSRGTAFSTGSAGEGPTPPPPPEPDYDEGGEEDGYLHIEGSGAPASSLRPAEDGGAAVPETQEGIVAPPRSPESASPPDIPASSHDRSVLQASTAPQAVSARATHAFEARYEDELSFRVGDLITLVRTPPGGWWEGRMRGSSGWFPSNHVQQLAIQALPTAEARRRGSAASAFAPPAALAAPPGQRRPSAPPTVQQQLAPELPSQSHGAPHNGVGLAGAPPPLESSSPRVLRAAPPPPGPAGLPPAELGTAPAVLRTARQRDSSAAVPQESLLATRKRSSHSQSGEEEKGAPPARPLRPPSSGNSPRNERRPSTILTHPCGNTGEPAAWTVSQVCRLLDFLGLPQYRETFTSNDISGELFLELDRTDLAELGVQALGHRKMLLKAIAGLASDPQWKPS